MHFCVGLKRKELQYEGEWGFRSNDMSAFCWNVPSPHLVGSHPRLGRGPDLPLKRLGKNTQALPSGS